ncbi:PepSY domain-containing protein [Dokdonia donghaensis]|uniref:PepSY domain-containing protein n=1 Tax=Dokdonia donghaensis TaxID=326320 RepID=UPI0035C7DAA5
MTLSIWRYSHFVLALVSSLFLLVAAITGVILAIEPIAHQAKGYDVRELDGISLGTTIGVVKENYDEVFALEVTTAGFVKAAVLTTKMETQDVYIDALTGETLAIVQERPAIYSFATNLHRSLFLKTLGRVFVGIIAFLLLAIAVTGFLLLIQRQGGLRKIFARVHKDYPELRYHVLLSRWFIIPIIIIAFTGVYLSAEKFELIPSPETELVEYTSQDDAVRYDRVTEIPFFKETMLSEVREVAFPFSSDPEEYYEIALSDKEVYVNQATGEIVKSTTYPFIEAVSKISWVLHTGEGTVLWSIVLLLASVSILYFMYSGCVMSIKRLSKKGRTLKMPDKDDCEYIILVGSETGTSHSYARALYQDLTAGGKNVFMTMLNTYSAFAKAQHIIIFTSTYGEGEAPTNARKFIEKFKTISQPNEIAYAVVGFGSREYADYCKFAIQVDGLLQAQAGFIPQLPLHKIDNGDVAQIKEWGAQYGKRIGVTLPLDTKNKVKKAAALQDFKVLKRTQLNVDETFIITLQPVKKTSFISGDLLAIIPPDTTVARQYSIARVGDTIVLSVKKHSMGKGSSYLYSLNEGTIIKASINHNSHFHLPKKARQVVMIANGTGIAPFIGMLDTKAPTEFYVFWGSRTAASTALYDDYLLKKYATNPRVHFYKSHSREGDKQYVQDALRVRRDILLKVIEDKGVIMICGSLAMQNDVLDLLEETLSQYGTTDIASLKESGQLKTDCY